MRFKDEHELERFVEELRERLGVPDDVNLDVIDLLNRMKYVGEIGGYEAVNKSVLSGADAEFEPESRLIRLAEDIANKAARGDPYSRFTVAHEVMHAALNHQHARNRLTGAKRQHGKQKSLDEREANAAAAALLVPYRLSKYSPKTTPEELAQRFGVSRKTAEIRLAALGRIHQKETGERRPIPESVRKFLARERDVLDPASASEDYEVYMRQLHRQAEKYR